MPQRQPAHRAPRASCRPACMRISFPNCHCRAGRSNTRMCAFGPARDEVEHVLDSFPVVPSTMNATPKTAASASSRPATVSCTSIAQWPPPHSPASPICSPVRVVGDIATLSVSRSRVDLRLFPITQAGSTGSRGGIVPAPSNHVSRSQQRIGGGRQQVPSRWVVQFLHNSGEVIGVVLVVGLLLYSLPGEGRCSRIQRRTSDPQGSAAGRTFGWSQLKSGSGSLW